MKYDGNSWAYVGGAGFSDAQATYISMDIDDNGNIYVLYEDEANSDKLTVMKYNGTSWYAVGGSGFVAHGGNADDTYLDLAVESDGMPYVVYTQDGSEKAVVKRYNKGSWEFVGSSFGLPSAGPGSYDSIAIDSTGVPYVGFQDAAMSIGKANVIRFNGSDWVSVGSPNFSADLAYYTSIAINQSNIPYIVFRDKANESKATVMKYDGSDWTTVDNAGSSPIVAGFTEIAIDKSNTQFVLYSTYSSGRELNLTVMYAPSQTCDHKRPGDR